MEIPSNKLSPLQIAHIKWTKEENDVSPKCIYKKDRQALSKKLLFHLRELTRNALSTPQNHLKHLQR